MFSKRNSIHPFENTENLEFLSQKNDASFFCIASHSKKRPNNLTLVRMFDYQVLNIIELGIKEHVPMDIIKVMFPKPKKIECQVCCRTFALCRFLW
jgi:ribosome production factor 2